MAQATMAKTAWGIRRTCQACATRFYDLQRSPIVCPKCSAPYELIIQTRGRRGRQSSLDDSKKAILDDLSLDPLNLQDDLDDSDNNDTLDDNGDDLDEDLEDVGNVIEHGHDDD